MAGAAGKVKALEQWCKARTSGYREVDVKDMARSWRSGLAFCALIHKYRPDLIDYESLSKENVLANNRLAFQTAEHELGIPALLDAEDMARLEVPDRLSIITYVAQYYNYFRDKEPAGGPGVSAPIKRQRAAPAPASPEAKRQMQDSASAIPAAAASAVAAAGTAGASLNTIAPLTVSAANGALPAAGSADPCTLCGGRVYLLERFIDAGQLYHRACHRAQSTGKPLAVAPTSFLQRAAEASPPRQPSSAQASAADVLANSRASASFEEIAASEAVKSAARTKVMSALASSMQPGFGRPASATAPAVPSPGKVTIAAAERTGADGAATEVGADVLAAKLAKLRQLRQKAREAGADDGSDRLSRVTQKMLARKGDGSLQGSEPGPSAGAMRDGGAGSGGRASNDELTVVDGSSRSIRPIDPALSSLSASGITQPQQPAASSKTLQAAVPREVSGHRTTAVAAAAAAASPVSRGAAQPERSASAAVVAVAPEAAAHGAAAATSPSRPAAVGPAAASAVTKAPADARAEVPAKKLDSWRPSPPDVAPAAGVKSAEMQHSGSGKGLPASSSAGSSASAPAQGLPARPAQLPHPASIPESHKSLAHGTASSGIEVKAEGARAVAAAGAAVAEHPVSGGGAAGIVSDSASELVPTKPSRMLKKKMQPGGIAELESGLPIHGRPHGGSLTLPASSVPAQAVSLDSASDSTQYPSDLNPFGTDDNEAAEVVATAAPSPPMAPAARGLPAHGGRGAASAGAARGSVVTAGSALAPRSASTIAVSSRATRSVYDSTLNPFGPDEEADEEQVAHTPSEGPPVRLVLPPPQPSASSSPVQQQQQQRKKLVPDVEFDFERSFEDHVSTKRRQKAPAPARPPLMPVVVPNVAPESGAHLAAAATTAPAAAISPARPSSLAPGDPSADASPAVTPGTLRKKKPAPTPPTAPPLPTSASGITVPQKQPHQSSNRQADEPLTSSGEQQQQPAPSVVVAAVSGRPLGEAEITAAAGAEAVATGEHQAQPKKSKPAPPRPMPPGRRSVASAESELGMTLLEVERELQMLEQKQQELEEQGRTLEEDIRRAEAAPAASEQDDELLLAKWLDMVNEKNRLVRRESELVYVCKQHTLEERQADIEWDLRQIMNKPECQKTDADKRLEEELLQEMITVVQERNKLVESLDEDRLRQLEEDKEIELAMNSHAASDSPASAAASKSAGSGGGGKVKAKKEKKVKEKKSKAGRP